MDFSLLLSSYATVWSNPEVLLMTFIGALGGVLLGAIPGMTATMGVALLIPFSFGMDLIPSIGLLLGIYCGGMYGGSISAILIHAPGTPAAAATLLDGYPMCKKGQAGKALSVAMFASFCGGVIGALVMTFLSPLVADMAMNFGPGEMFMLAVFGLSVIVAISGKSVAKGLISAFFGMLLCTVGLDPTNGIPRFITTKQTGLLDGFQFIPTLIGLFAVSEVIAGVERIIRGEEHEQKSNEKITNVLPDWKTIKQIWPNILSGGLIGTFIGAIPGAGGDIAVFVSYGASKSASKHPELYGTGIPNGVAATESANNGCSGGAMIPLLSLGGKGVISVVSNVKPELVHNCCKAWFDGDTAKARELQLEMLPLCDALFCEVNPIPVKYAMNVLGWEAGECRLPLVEPSDAHKEQIEQALQAAGLIKE
jgi:putative tricarboxylic transport membrane protein